MSNDTEKGGDKLEVYSSTGNIFYGWNVRNSWKREDQAWQEMERGTSNSSYRFPELGQSVYLDDSTKVLNQPVICRNLFWSNDGTSFVTVHDDYGIRQYLVPEYQQHAGVDSKLLPFTRYFKNQSIVASQVHPKYSLYNDSANFNMILLASRGVPLQLYPLSVDADTKVARPLQSFDVTDINNDSFQVPYAIDFLDDQNFFVGSVRNRVSLYDITRKEPVWTIQSTKKDCGNSIHKAIVSCFDQQGNQAYSEDQHRMFGTYKSELYRIDTRTTCSQFVYRSPAAGNGFIQILKSANGHYLYILKRNCDIIEILDTRHSCRKVNELKLPFRITSQKFEACLTPSGGLSVGTDHGSVINWNSDLVEFGGISRNANPACQNPEVKKISPDCEYALPYINSKINIIKQSPAESDIYAISYSPDKFLDEPTDLARSGIAVARHFIA